MEYIYIGEKVINKKNDAGTIISFDENYINLDFQGTIKKYQIKAFENGVLKYENVDLQLKINNIIEQNKIKEAQKKEEELQIREANEMLVRAEREKFETINDAKITIRLDAEKISFRSVKKKDQELIQMIFNECDKKTQEIYTFFKPKMTYPKKYKNARSRYYAGFLDKYLDYYVLRIFSRQDIYSKNKNSDINIVESDTTEILRILYINNNLYYFSKHFAYCRGFYLNSTSYPNWHISNKAEGVLLNDVSRLCDCKYINDYIKEENVICTIYARLLFPALYDNKAEIVFKDKRYSICSDELDVSKYLEPFSSKQIDFASKNNVLSTLPVINKNGIYDLDILNKMELVMKKTSYRGSIYNQLETIFKRRNYDCSKLIDKLIHFVKKVDPFYENIYEDYIYLLNGQINIDVNDFFDRNYMRRHDIYLKEKLTVHNKEIDNKYREVALTLSWIDRKDNNYFIIIPKTIDDFAYEGRLQHHCVYTSRYYELVIRRNSVIVFLRKEELVPYVTIEFSYPTFEIIQAFGKYNKKIDQSLYEYIKTLGKTLLNEMYLHS